MDTLILSISEISEELKEIDSVKMELIWNEVMTIRTSIQENYQSDTLSLELAQELEDYKLTGSQALWVKNNLPIALKTNSETESRIKQLRADILTGVGGKKYVFIVVEGKLVKKPVKIGVGNYERVEIIEGLDGTELVARPLDGIELIEGMKVKTDEKKWP